MVVEVAVVIPVVSRPEDHEVKVLPCERDANPSPILSQRERGEVEKIG